MKDLAFTRRGAFSESAASWQVTFLRLEKFLDMKPDTAHVPEP